MFSLKQNLNTSGDGYWSNQAKSVTVTGLRVAYINNEQDFGELRVFFDPKSWNVDKDGLIYTDKQFLKELRALLDSLGLVGSNVDYSEQGMQGMDYVSCDVGQAFLDSWKAECTIAVVASKI